MILAVGFGGAGGALARYWVSESVSNRGKDTLVVNILGSFLLGLLLGSPLDGILFGIVAVGFCGAFTTFSTHVVELVRFSEEGHTQWIILYWLTMVLGAIVALCSGMVIGGYF